MTGRRWAGCMPPTPPSCCWASAIPRAPPSTWLNTACPAYRHAALISCFTAEGGTRVEHEFTDIDLDDSDFELLGAELESAADGTPRRAAARTGRIGGMQADAHCVWPSISRAPGWRSTASGLSHDKTASALSIFTASPLPWPSTGGAGGGVRGA